MPKIIAPAVTTQSRTPARARDGEEEAALRPPPSYTSLRDVVGPAPSSHSQSSIRAFPNSDRSRRSQQAQPLAEHQEPRPQSTLSCLVFGNPLDTKTLPSPTTSRTRERGIITPRISPRPRTTTNRARDHRVNTLSLQFVVLAINAALIISLVYVFLWNADSAKKARMCAYNDGMPVRFANGLLPVMIVVYGVGLVGLVLDVFDTPTGFVMPTVLRNFGIGTVGLLVAALVAAFVDFGALSCEGITAGGV